MEANVNERGQYGRTALHRAAEAGDLHRVQDLIGRGADTEARDDWRRTALIMASREGHADCVEALILAGADVNAVNRYDMAALHRASERGHLRVVHILLQHNAALDTRDSHGETPLLKITRRGDGEACGLALLHAGASVTVRDEVLGITALHNAARWGMLAVVVGLLRQGADADARSFHQGPTPEAMCQVEWEQFPENYLALTKRHKREVLEALGKASLANARWRRRKLVVMLQARHDAGEDITAGFTDPSPAQVELERLVLWLVRRPQHEMQALFKSIVMFL